MTPARPRVLPRAAFLCCVPVALTLLSGCAIGTTAGDVGIASAPAFKGVIHGGPNPVVGARVVIYSTTSNGYGTGNMLQEANQVGSVAHNDTDANGQFSFAGGYSCPAGQFAYIAAYGGNTGANANNPNSLLMAALGRCEDLYSGTSYSGGNIILNELTTISAGYALSNFLTVTGNASTGYTVGVGAPATNNAQSGCVSNAYYTTAACPTTAAAGLRHAFANAAILVNPFTGQANTTSSNGAIIPTQLINSLGNILQACVNSTGGGTNTAGAPTTTTSASGTSNDGTTCGKLFAYTSYTADGTATGALTAAGNTLDAVRNLAKRPTGSATQFDSACSSNGTGTTSATSCIFNLGAPSGYYNVAMSAAPPDWTMGISYPKGSFSTAASAVTCASSLTTQPTTNGLLYPYMVATDINDNVVMVNGDSGTPTCYNLIAIGADGSTLGANAFDPSNGAPVWLSTDSYGHAIVPVHSTSVAAANGVRVYDFGTSAADATIPLIQTVQTAISAAANLPYYTAVDQNDNIFLAAQNSTNDLGYLTYTGPKSHATAVYTGTTTTTAITSKFNMISADINGNAFTTTSSSSGTSKTYVIAAGFGNNTALGPLTGSTSNGETTVADISGNVWNVQGPSAANYTAAQGTPAANLLVFKQQYTAGAGSTPTISAPTTTTLTPGDYKQQPGQIDGNNVIWVADQQGANNGTTGVFTGNIRGFDTTVGFDTGKLMGCKFTNSSSTACGAQPTDTTFPNTAPYLTLGTRGIAIDAAGSIWLANGVQGQLNEIIGLAAPTLPLYIHNGVSNKP